MPAFSIHRVFVVVIDGVGAGALPDAVQYGDSGADTLGNLSRALTRTRGRSLHLPHLQKLGIGNLTPMEGISPLQAGEGQGAYGRAREQSQGKDTTSGHWEMMGLVVSRGFATFPNGFSKEVLQEWIHQCGLPGVLGNCAASGTEIIERLGAEHVRTGKPIVYTSADSVWQVAAHEDVIPLARLHEICEVARKICDRLNISRVISRPFVGNPEKGIPYKRTYNRKDYAQLPDRKTILDHLVDAGVPTLGIGKISNIYAGQGISKNIDTKGNTDGLRVLLEQVEATKKGLIFCNLIDFDMLWGHRRDVEGFGGGLEEFDEALGRMLPRLGSGDLLVITADHGNDPTFPGSDHTREYAPILVDAPALRPRGAIALGDRESFGDLGATIWEALTGHPTVPTGLTGQSFLRELQV